MILILFCVFCLNLAAKFLISTRVTKQHSHILKVRNVFIKDKAINNTEPINLLCIVLTSTKSIFERVGALYDTWAYKCNKTLFACNCNLNTSNVNVSSKNLDILKKIEFLNLTKEESYDRMAEKVMDTIKMSYEFYGKTHNWFLLVDDDTYIFYNNLIRFIKTKSSKRPHTYGYNFKTLSGYQSGNF